MAAETLRPEALIRDQDRDPADIVLRRTAALLADLQRKFTLPQLAEPARKLAELQAANASIDVASTEARYALFTEACQLRRQIAFANPLLDFDEILFIKRHRALINHMCDQYYGMAATPGGGLYVLSGAFGAEPRRARSAGRRGCRAGPVAGAAADRRSVDTARGVVRRNGQPQRRRQRRRLFSLARPVIRRPVDPVCLRRVRRRPAAPAPHGSRTRPLGRGTLLPHFPDRRRGDAPRAADGRDVERLRSVLVAQRPDRVHQRAAGRLPALRPGVSHVHAVRHGGRRQRRYLLELPRDATSGIPA